MDLSDYPFVLEEIVETFESLALVKQTGCSRRTILNSIGTHRSEKVGRWTH